MEAPLPSPAAISFQNCGTNSGVRRGMPKRRPSAKYKPEARAELEPSPPHQLAPWGKAPRDRIWRDFPKGCLVCGRGDHDGDPLGLYLDGTKDTQSSWVHQGCWARWQDRGGWQQWWNEHRKAYCPALSKLSR